MWSLTHTVKDLVGCLENILEIEAQKMQFFFVRI